MRTFLILFSAVLLVAFANAQRKFNITKPVVNLEKRPRPPVWNRPPEERRKLSIFPRNNVKFVVTPKTVVNNDDVAKDGLPTKRPLMRKFIMRDRNEKGTWSFAPREPLMKTNRFTVTLAPSKAIDEMKSEESKKVNTVISKVNTEQLLSKKHNLNKGNLIEIMQIKMTEPPASKNSEKVEKKFIEEEISHKNKVNETNNFDTIEINDNSTSTLDKVSKDYPIDIRRLNDEDVIVSSNETVNEYVKLNKTAVTLNNQISKNFLESRAVDLNELKYAIEQHESNSLTMDEEEIDNYSTAQVLSFNDLEILLEKIVNNTASYNENNNSNYPKNETIPALEDIPKFDVSKPNELYDVIPLSNDEGNKTLAEEFPSGSILHVPQIMTNDEKHHVSETNILNGEDFSENGAVSVVVGNQESFINFMEKETAGIENHYHIGIDSESAEIKSNTKDTLTEKPFTNNPTNEIISYFNSDTKYETKSEFLKEFNSSETDNRDSTEILLEMYESNVSLSSEELSDELLTEVPNESLTGNVNLTIVEIPNEAFNESVSVDEISNESISDTSNGYIEERSNESLMNTSTAVEIFNEPILNMAGEEISNESNKSYNLTEEISSEPIIEVSQRSTDKKTSQGLLIDNSDIIVDERISDKSVGKESSSLVEEISNEYIIESFNNSNSEEISNVSSSNMAGEEISNESYPDKSNNLTEETSSEYTMESSNNVTGEEISNESSSKMAGEELSIEPSSSIEEISNEYIIESYINSNGEEISNESSSNMAGEEISNESYPDKSNNSTEETSSEYTIETSNNVAAEEISNETSSNMSGEEISNESDKSYNLTEEISSEPIIEISQSSTDEKTSQGLLIDNSGIIIDETISEKSVASSLEPEISKEALTNRFKRSNNIIEEENLPTTVSGFKYTGNEITLNQDLSYRNINA